MRKVFISIMLSFLATLSPAQAVTSLSTPAVFSRADVGLGYRMTFNMVIGSTEVAGLGGILSFHLIDVNKAATAWTFSSIVSDISGPLPLRSRVSSFGFNVFDDSKAKLTGTAFTTAAATGDFTGISYDVSPPQFKESFDVCFRFAGNPGCNGGGGGVFSGNSSPGTFTLNFSKSVGEVRLDNFFTRYQSVDIGKGKGDQGLSGVGYVILDEAIPEPGTWAMLIVGFGLVGAAARRRRYSTQSSPLSR